jgi:FKBP-type peptidyl-prolyl cis-trans isomerase SlyD
VQIGPQKVVSLEYKLKDDSGKVLDSSKAGEPLRYLHGAGTLVPGLEKALEGRRAGDHFEVTLTPAEAYGERNERLVRNIPVRKLRHKQPQVGARYPVETEEGTRIVLVIALRGDYATVDGNHPLVGMTLHFEITVLEVREATSEELSHGHVHGAGGHHH